MFQVLKLASPSMKQNVFDLLILHCKGKVLVPLSLGQVSDMSAKTLRFSLSFRN